MSQSSESYILLAVKIFSKIKFFELNSNFDQATQGEIIEYWGIV